MAKRQQSSQATQASGVASTTTGPVAVVERFPLRILDWIAMALLVIGVFLLILVYIIGPLGINSAREGIATRHAERSVVFLGSDFDVRLRLDGAALPICPTEASAGSAVALVIDNSGSMSGPPLREAKNAAQGFVDNLSLARGGDAVSVVVFSSSAQQLSALGIDADIAKSAIEEIGDGGGTAIDEGLNAARQSLAGEQTNRAPIIVLLSDGNSDSGAALAQANAAKADGVRIITIALGDADQILLQQVASNADDFYLAPDPTALQGVYEEIAGTVGPVVATDVQVTETYEGDHFTPADGSDARPINRRFKVMTTSGRQISYQLQAPNLGWWRVTTEPGTLVYSDCNEQPVSQALPAGPQVLVLFPFFCLLIPLLLALLWLLLRLLYWYWKNYIWEPPLSSRAPRPFPSRRPLTSPLQWNGPTTRWEPEPALVIGLGGTGRWVLTHLKRNLLDAAGGAWRPQIQLLTLDTAAQEYVGGVEQSVQFGGVRLTKDETLVVTEENLNSLIKELAQARAGEREELTEWFPAEDYDARLGPAQKDLAKGTNGRRPMGRMAIFRNLKDGLAASTLWQRLTGSVQKVKEAAQERNVQYERLRVLIVGSLAGGFGSGSVIDVAYLARRACEKEGFDFTDAEVSLFLVGNAPFDAQRDMLGMLPITQINTCAALREVERFLLSRNRPFPIHYAYKKGKSIPKDEQGVLQEEARNIIDDCWFLDGERDQYSLATRNTPPDQALFPMLADALTVLLDTQAQSAGAALGGLRQQVAGQAQSLQAELGQGVFSSLGAFTYRLPMRDLVSFLKVRFARQLLALLLTGDLEANVAQPLSSSDNREASGVTPQQHASNFIAGRSGSGEAPFSLQIASAIRTDTPLSEYQEALTDVGLRSHKEGREKYLEHETKDFSLYLNDAIWRLLNGKSPAIVSARTGKLAYTQAFLRELMTLLNQIAKTKNWPQGQRNLPRWTSNVVEILPELLARYNRVANTLLRQLQEQEKILRTVLFSEGQTEGTANSVVDELTKQTALAETALGSLYTVRHVRHYFLADDQPQTRQRREALLDKWYRDHFAPQLSKGEALEYLVWELPGEQNRVSEASALSLCVRTYADEGSGVLLAKNSIPDFTEALLSLAEYAGRQIWQQQQAVQLLTDALEPISQDQRQLQELHQRSEPVLPYIAGGVGQHVSKSRLLWSPEVSTDLVWVQLQNTLIEGLMAHDVIPLSKVGATDPFSCTLLQLYDYVATRAIPRMTNLEQSYLNYYGMVLAVGRGRVQAGAANPEPSAVFPAERRAGENFERRMLIMPERQAWLLSSLFVGALDNFRRADLFLQAYAAGLVNVVPTSQPFEKVSVLTLAGDELHLTAPINHVWQVAPEIVGMQNFVLGSDDRRLTEQPNWKKREQKLQAALKQIGETELKQRWYKFDQRYLNRSRTQNKFGFDDLVICARILVRARMGMLSR